MTGVLFVLTLSKFAAFATCCIAAEAWCEGRWRRNNPPT